MDSREKDSETPASAGAAEIDRLIAAIHRRGDLNLSAAERALLSSAPPAHIRARKILAADAYNAGRHAEAAALMEDVHRRAPDAETLRNLVSIHARLRNHDRALALLDTGRAGMDPILHATRTAEVLASAGRVEEARARGREALRLKDEAAPVAQVRTSMTTAFDPERPAGQVISFSLWGAGRAYLDGALRNAIAAPHVYPGWTVRFHVDDSVPKDFCARLAAEGAEVRRMAPDWPAARYGLFWRFFVEDDPGVRIYIVRDADSVVNVREAAAVRAWLASGRPFHLMRDWPTHCDLMLAGMWGAHRGNIGDMRGRVRRHVEAQAGTLNDRAGDQRFLGTEIWPLVRGRVLAHDSAFGMGEPFPEGTAMPWPMHVGQNDQARVQMVRQAQRRRAAAAAEAAPGARPGPASPGAGD